MMVKDILGHPLKDLISLLTPKVWRFSEKSYSSGSTYTPGDGTATASLLFTTTLLESTAHDAFFTKHSGSLDIVTPGIYHMVFSEGGYCSTRFYSNITINGNVICEGMAPSSGHYTNAISDVCWLLNAGDVVKCTETYEGSNRSKLLGGKYTFFNIEYLGHL